MEIKMNWILVKNQWIEIMEKHRVISSQSLIWKDELNKRDKRKCKDKREKFLAQ